MNLRTRLPGVAIALASLLPSAVYADVACIEAVFFDLGDTLVENPGSGVFETRDGVPELLAALADREVRVGVITNVPAGWDRGDLEAILADPGLLDAFEVVILSSEAPAPKPDPAIYTFAHAALAGPRPPITATAFVGETLSEIANLEEDPTSGARAVGMIGIHLSDQPPSPLTDFTIPTEAIGQVASIVDETCDAVDVAPSELDQGSLRILGSPTPNPTRGAAWIRFETTSTGRVQVAVHDVGGRAVTTLLDTDLAPGRHVVRLGEGMGPGVAYVAIRAGGVVAHRRLVVLPD